MDWQTIITFSICFWGTYHLLNSVKDWRNHRDLARILRDMDNLAAKIEDKKSVRRVK